MSEPRAGLGARKPRRPHPALPSTVDGDEQRPPGVGSLQGAGRDDGLVMLCVRVAPSLRRRIKLAAASSGQPIQALATDALEALCRHHDV
jgi:hypothetical protein